MRNKLISLALSTLLLAFGSAAWAQAPAAGGNIEFKNVAEVEVSATGADGKAEKKRVPVQKAVPGTEVIYTSTFKNISKKPAGKILINNPIPANTTLVAASAFGENMEITFSADGGKTWAPAAQVKVKGADGKERMAGLSEFTHIRWSYLGELPPGQQGVAGFRVVIN